MRWSQTIWSFNSTCVWRNWGNHRTGENCAGSGYGIFKLLHQHLPGRT